MLIERSIERFITADKSEERTIKKISGNQYSQESIFMHYEFAKTLPTGLKIVSGFLFRVCSIVTLAPQELYFIVDLNNLFKFYHPCYHHLSPLFLIQLTRETEGLNTTQETKLKYKFHSNSLNIRVYIYIYLPIFFQVYPNFVQISSL